MAGDGERVVLQALRGAARTDPDTQVRLNLYATLMQALRFCCRRCAALQSPTPMRKCCVLTCADVCWASVLRTKPSLLRTKPTVLQVRCAAIEGYAALAPRGDEEVILRTLSLCATN